MQFYCLLSFVLEHMKFLFSILILVTQQFSVGHQAKHEKAPEKNLKTGK